VTRPILQPPPGEVAHARAQLIACGAPLVEVHSLRRDIGRTWTGREKFVFSPVPAGRGWLLGDLIWTYSIRPRDGGGERTEPVLTLLSELPPEYGQHGGLARVRADRDHGGFLTLGGWATINSWEEAKARIAYIVTGASAPGPNAGRTSRQWRG
jgi:hypothetical protein